MAAEDLAKLKIDRSVKARPLIRRRNGLDWGGVGSNALDGEKNGFAAVQNPFRMKDDVAKI
jgi:hypothetical protein